MRQYRTSGTVQGAPGNRRSYCRRVKAAFLSRRESHLSTAPAGSHRRGHGEVAVWRATLIAYSFKIDFIDGVRPGDNNRCLGTNFIEQLLVRNKPIK